jgi:hypothetical protein
MSSVRIPRSHAPKINLMTSVVRNAHVMEV